MNKYLLRVIATVAVLAPAISANAAPYNYNEQFDANSIHYNLNFTADDTDITVITTFNGTADLDTLILAPTGLFGFSNNVFDPATLVTTGGWDNYGLGFHNSVSGLDFNLWLGSGDLYLAHINDTELGYVISNYIFSSSPVSSVPVPTAVWLFASGLGLLGFGRRKKLLSN
ncbi:PEP-CTERM sorting domain-containing protein [Methylobacter psychrophilus]|uniref:PEP-CTERM sorting domain-containing protein n=1 Tax=Methylobacter psychrophilus TaxID=96941 RepID=UPI0021D490F4|nr:PEP-CTERM sorting domain-containing protein [Methylobacter psychrophilus]